MVPPNVPNVRESVSLVVWAAYDAWAGHHAGCALCGQHEWMNPGAPVVRLTDPGEPGWQGPGRTWYGRPFWWKDTADPAVLCARGRQLWKKWERVTLFLDAPDGQRSEAQRRHTAALKAQKSNSPGFKGLSRVPPGPLR
jgi:hypothetical protein